MQKRGLLAKAVSVGQKIIAFCDLGSDSAYKSIPTSGGSLIAGITPPPVLLNGQAAPLSSPAAVDVLAGRVYSILDNDVLPVPPAQG